MSFELPELVRDSIPDVPVEKREFGSSITEDVYNYTGLNCSQKLYWKPSSCTKDGTVFYVKNGKEKTVGRARTPFSLFYSNKELDKRREDIFSPHLLKYSKLLTELIGNHNQREIMISKFIVEILGSIDKDDFSELLLCGASARQSILNTLKRLFKRECKKLLN